MKKNFFALIIGIEKYNQENISNLKGCLNDVEGIEQFIDSYCNSRPHIHLNKKLLINLEATRKAIITAFDHFNDAKDGDICFLYFSGHGARVEAPKEFWNTTDNQLEAIVCYRDLGNDSLLIDKELSYLLEKATYGKELHFTVIMDCCNSGSNTKGIDDGVRSVPFNLDSRHINDFLGRSEYKETPDEAGNIVRLDTPIGRHYKLSACLKNELSKEKILGPDNKVRGAFTYALLQALNNNGSKISYANLIAKTRVQAQLLTSNQSPQLELIDMPSSEKSRLLFDGILEDEVQIFQVTYRPQNEWTINTGTIFGVSEKDDVFVQIDKRSPIKTFVKRVEANFSLLDMDALALALDKKEMYNATIIKKNRRKLNLAFHKDCDEQIAAIIKQQIGEDPSLGIEMTADKAIDFEVHAKKTYSALTYANSLIPVFQRVKSNDVQNQRLFIKLIDKVAKWYDVAFLNNKNTTLSEDDIHFELSAVIDYYKSESTDAAQLEPIADWHEGGVFHYQYDESFPKGPWHPPAFRLLIKNKSKKNNFFINVLYCGIWYKDDSLGRNVISTNFSVSDKFQPKEQLAPEQSLWLTDIVVGSNRKAFEYKSLELSVLDDYHQQGFTEIHDMLKIIVATEEFDTKPFILEGIPLDTEGVLGERPARNAALVESQKADWRTFEIPITIVKPRDMGIWKEGEKMSFYGVSLLEHKEFSAKVVLSTMEDFIRSTRLKDNKSLMPRIETLHGSQNVEVLNFTPNLGRVEGCSVIELFRYNGIKNIGKDKPLKMSLDKSLITGAEHHFWLFTYDSNKRVYIPLSQMNDKKEFIVTNEQEVLKDSPSSFKGLGPSLIFFFLKVKKTYQI